MPEAARAQRLLGLGHLLRGLPRVALDAEQEARFRNGQTLKAFPGEGLCAVYGAHGAVLGLAQADAGALRPLRLLASSQAADKHRKTL